ncbi:MAG: T9SS type A sorting domain-containing protein [Bacteroidota bacterium]
MRKGFLLSGIAGILFIMNVTYASTSPGDTCGTTGSLASNSIPTSGTIKVFVVFVQFKDDTLTENGGWALNSYPSWANDFVSSNGSGPFAYNNLSQYFYEMSNVTFMVEGDVYDSLIITNNNESNYSNIAAVNYEVLTRIDPYVDFSLYDNLNGSVPGHDGKVDFIYIIYRNVSDAIMPHYSGMACLPLTSTITTNDGVQIVGNNYIGSGVHQKGGCYGRDYTMYISAHEMGHYLFGSGHEAGASNLSLMSGPAWNAGRGMNSWERHKIGWVSYTDQSSDGSITLSDYITTRNVCRIPISSSEYFLIENRQKISAHDWAGDRGIYIYHIKSANSYPPWIKVECADGNWNFVRGYHTLTRTTPNPSSQYNEMNYNIWVDGFQYACYTPVYPTNAAWGDENDAFDLTYNNVYSPVSNPRSTNTSGINFSLEVTAKDQNDNYTCTLYFSNPYNGKPSKPQNLGATYNSSCQTILTWNANSEPDLASYKIYKAKTTGAEPASYNYVTTVLTPTITWTDKEINIGDITWKVFYKITAVDNSGKESVLSEYSYVNYLTSTIASNTTYDGNVITDRNITVSNGITLTIQPGTGNQLVFNNNSSLIANGTLNAVGTSSNRITFDFVSPNSSAQNGIKFNSSSGSSLSYCDIKNAYAAIYCNGASTLPPISYCVISNNTMGIRLNNVVVSSSQISHNKIISNSYYGILLYNSSPTNISIDTILNSPYYGVYCLSGSTPYLYYNIIKNDTVGVFCDHSSAHLTNYAGDSAGHNVIKNNGCGISCAYTSNLFAGSTSKRGLNSIYNNTSYAILVAYGTNVVAQYNWWNRYPPQDTGYYRATDFSIQSGSSIIYSPAYRPSDPNSGMGKAVVAENWESEGNTTELPGRQVVAIADTTPVFDSEFDAALDNMSKRRFDDAIAQYLQKFKKEKNIGKRRYALIQLAECYRSAEKKDFIDFLDREIRPGLSRNDELFAKTLELENLFLIGDGKYDQAIKNYNTLMKDFSGNKEMYKHALFNIWYVYYNELKDTINSKGYISELKAKYPDDDLTMFCMVLLGEIITPKRIAAPPGLGKGEMASKEEVPNEFALFENYPNPFNPTTSIGYQIPQEGFVMIKIYDVLGREVASLINEYQKPGKYNVEFNAANLSSGFYIYQLKVNDFISTKKMLLLK